MANFDVNIDRAIAENRDLVKATLPTARSGAPALPTQQGFNLLGKVCGIAIAPDSDVPEATIRVRDEQAPSTAFVGLGQPITVQAPLMLLDGTPIQYDVGSGLSANLDVIIPYHMRVDQTVSDAGLPWIFYQPFLSVLLYMRTPSQIPIARADKSDNLALTISGVVGTVPLWRLYVMNRRRVQLVIVGPAGNMVTIQGRIYPSDTSAVPTTYDIVAATAIPASARLVLSFDPGPATDLNILVNNLVDPTNYFLAYHITDVP